VYYDLRQLRYERHSARMLNVAPMLAELREDRDV
jgi:hypothetical protein